MMLQQYLHAVLRAKYQHREFGFTGLSLLYIQQAGMTRAVNMALKKRFLKRRGGRVYPTKLGLKTLEAALTGS